MPTEHVSPIPFGLGVTKPHNYWEVLRTAWENKRNPLFTWRILRDGVCDGCALGTTGMKDFTMKGIHLCTVRLNLLPLNTMGPLDPRILEDVEPLRSVSSKGLRALGRLPYPMLRRRGDRGFHRIGSDLIVFFGSDVPNNQPVTTKYLYYAKKQGTKIAVVNPMREPGLERYWVPSVPDSALFGTRFADAFFPIHTGGDIAFINGVLKHMIEKGWIHDTFVAAHTTGFGALRASLEKQSWEELEVQSGLRREAMFDFADMYVRAETAVFVWSMGITHHRFGVDNVRAIVNLGLAGGIVGRPKCGLMPIRGHSGVQGGSEMGATPKDYALGFPVGEENAARFERLWGFRPPTAHGMTAVGMIDAAHAGNLDVLYMAGGNFLETLPEPEYVREALGRVPLRIHQDIVLSSAMLVEPAYAVLLFPAETRYEQRGGGTETSTERRVYFSPEIPGRRIGEARAEWEIFMQLAERVRPDTAKFIHFDDAAAIRKEIAAAIPTYEGIQNLREKGDVFQYGGPRLCEGGTFPTPDGKARF